MYAEERQQAMATQVSAQGRRSVADLAQDYGVTTETVRRDLSVLERLGLVRRVHGGAVPASGLTSLEVTLGERGRAQTEEKRAIARAALDLLPPAGASVLLDAGSTTARLAAVLPEGHALTVYTHAVPLLTRLVSNPALAVHVLPGRVRQTTRAAVGPDTVAALADLRVDVAFVGANGVSLAHGLSTPDPEEAATKRALVSSARRVVALADASKIGVDAMVRFAGLDDVDTLVTDSSVDPAQRRALTEAGLEVVVG
ncbi:DeoR/GlpR family DNA-binding transcription regulator [Nocardioides panacisoli]|uniref:DeoR/GlpR family DNA-binding transcription regulator n=1 Tax=Nocardioides panacisoli TaxID=627624 RepID=UPI001C628DAB|nr:DeoR/GlpR family DNA-binding transcription regulator [Nocardioides panacisoli]QYJ05653.1 DeoR/GlpR family DNA-binding transcription regulator [Nocardioides panacisoli]